MALSERHKRLQAEAKAKGGLTSSGIAKSKSSSSSSKLTYVNKDGSLSTGGFLGSGGTKISGTGNKSLDLFNKKQAEKPQTVTSPSPPLQTQTSKPFSYIGDSPIVQKQSVDKQVSSRFVSDNESLSLRTEPEKPSYLDTSPISKPVSRQSRDLGGKLQSSRIQEGIDIIPKEKEVRTATLVSVLSDGKETRIAQLVKKEKKPVRTAQLVKKEKIVRQEPVTATFIGKTKVIKQEPVKAELVKQVRKAQLVSKQKKSTKQIDIGFREAEKRTKLNQLKSYLTKEMGFNTRSAFVPMLDKNGKPMYDNNNNPRGEVKLLSSESKLLKLAGDVGVAYATGSVFGKVAGTLMVKIPQTTELVGAVLGGMYVADLGARIVRVVRKGDTSYAILELAPDIGFFKGFTKQYSKGEQKAALKEVNKIFPNNKKIAPSGKRINQEMLKLSPKEQIKLEQNLLKAFPTKQVGKVSAIRKQLIRAGELKQNINKKLYDNMKTSTVLDIQSKKVAIKKSSIFDRFKSKKKNVEVYVTFKELKQYKIKELSGLEGTKREGLAKLIFKDGKLKNVEYLEGKGVERLDFTQSRIKGRIITQKTSKRTLRPSPETLKKTEFSPTDKPKPPPKKKLKEFTIRKIKETDYNEWLKPESIKKKIDKGMTRKQIRKEFRNKILEDLKQLEVAKLGKKKGVSDKKLRQSQRKEILKRVTVPESLMNKVDAIILKTYKEVQPINSVKRFNEELTYRKQDFKELSDKIKNSEGLDKDGLPYNVEGLKKDRVQAIKDLTSFIDKFPQYITSKQKLKLIRQLNKEKRLGLVETLAQSREKLKSSLIKKLQEQRQQAKDEALGKDFAKTLEAQKKAKTIEQQKKDIAKSDKETSGESSQEVSTAQGQVLVTEKPKQVQIQKSKVKLVTINTLTAKKPIPLIAMSRFKQKLSTIDKQKLNQMLLLMDKQEQKSLTISEQKQLQKVIQQQKQTEKLSLKQIQQIKQLSKQYNGIVPIQLPDNAVISVQSPAQAQKIIQVVAQELKVPVEQITVTGLKGYEPLVPIEPPIIPPKDKEEELKQSKRKSKKIIPISKVVKLTPTLKARIENLVARKKLTIGQVFTGLEERVIEPTITVAKNGKRIDGMSAKVPEYKRRIPRKYNNKPLLANVKILKKYNLLGRKINGKN